MMLATYCLFTLLFAWYLSGDGCRPYFKDSHPVVRANIIVVVSITWLMWLPAFIITLNEAIHGKDHHTR